jgi:tRNA isopentenyl-2-thiomethyl-A-37 hydroxylase MiaE
LIDALLVGAVIEEIDLIDIQNLVDTLEGNEDIVLVYENLMKGSRNHLRAFVSSLEKQGETYQPQYLSQDVYDAIIHAGSETN